MISKLVFFCHGDVRGLSPWMGDIKTDFDPYIDEGIDFNNYFCLTRFEGNYEGKFKPFVTHAIFYEDFEVRL